MSMVLPRWLLEVAEVRCEVTVLSLAVILCLVVLVLLLASILEVLLSPWDPASPPATILLLLLVG